MREFRLIKWLVDIGIVSLEDTLEEGWNKLQIFIAELEGKEILDADDLELIP